MFLVTEKVWESESESDDDIIPPTPPVIKATNAADNTNKDKNAKV